MTVMTPMPSNQLHMVSTTTTMPKKKSLGPETTKISTTTLAAFSKHNTLLSPRDLKNQLQDVDSSVSTARTSCASSSHDDRSDCGNDSHWDELSTGSGHSDQDLDAWSSSTTSSGFKSQSHSHAVETSTAVRDAEEGPSTPSVAAWSEPRDIPNSHNFHHAAAIHTSSTVNMVPNSWCTSPSLTGLRRPHSANSPSQRPQHQTIASPSIPPQFRSMYARHAPPAPAAQFQAPRNGKGTFVGSPLQLSPVHLAALAASSSPSNPNPHSPANGAFAPRLCQVVQPIHIGPPTDYDFRNTNGLMKCLNSLAPLPTPEELSVKHLVINELQHIVDEWIRSTFPDEKEATATLLLGGSWHLKIGLFDSDLDIVVLLPSFVSSEVFFSSLHGYLHTKPSVSKLVSMNKATVPILGFQLNTVRIDLLFARYTQSVVPKNLPIHSDQILAGMDAASIRSLSVPRVASLILELVSNDGVFRACLRIVRHWAKCRGVYSNKAGFLGGISWTILVAFVCQMFPRATISSIVHRFFSILSTWQWPTPILISKPYECDGVDVSLQWNPQNNHHDRSHVMPIITPGFPAVNSAVNVNASTLRILKEEFERGKLIMDEMLAKGLSSPAVWQRLFAPSEFLVRYDHYVVVQVEASNGEELTEWSNYIASRTRKLVESLQHTSPIKDVHPFPELVKPKAAAADDAGAAASTGYYLIGFTLQAPASSASSSYHGFQGHRGSTSPQPKVEDTMKASVASAMRYFTATELDKCPERKQGMAVEIHCCKWQELPESIFPQGRTAAAGERARHILSRAHTSHVAPGHGR